MDILAPGMDCTVPEASKFDAMTGKKVSNDIPNYPTKGYLKFNSSSSQWFIA